MSAMIDVAQVRALFRAVIAQAMSDATTMNKTGFYSRKEKIPARKWLISYSDDFREVCEIAELDPAHVRAMAIAHLKHERNEPQPKPAPGPRATLYTFEGRTMSARDWAQEKGVNLATVKARLGAGKTIAEALSPLLKKRGTPISFPRTKTYTVDGKTRSKSEWMILNNLTSATVHSRVRAGWSLERALSTPRLKAGDRATLTPGVDQTSSQDDGDRSTSTVPDKINLRFRQ